MDFASIVNGLGASTTLSYLPLSNAEVYRNDANSRNTLDWGRGSAVQDVGGPSYVVAKAQSSAPTYADDNWLRGVPQSIQFVVSAAALGEQRGRDQGQGAVVYHRGWDWMQGQCGERG